MLIDAVSIAALVPHHGDMCLLDGVLNWDARHISCVSQRHRSSYNPLRQAGRLGILCGVEYAAQAMALHGALTAGRRARAPVGYLASLRGLSWSIDRLDLLEGTLLIEVERLHGEDNRRMYGFTLSCDTRILLQGRAAVVLDDVAP